MEATELQLLFLTATLLIVGAIWLIYYALRDTPGKWPTDAFQWSTVGIASMVGGLAVGLAFLVLAFSANPARLDTGETADVLPEELDAAVGDFSFRLVADGSEMRFSELAGKVVLVNIWATWCPPCLFEMPELNRLQQDYEAEGLVVLNLSDEDRQNLLTFASELPLSTLSAYVDPATVPEPLQRNFAVRPASFIIDRGGILRVSVLGARDYEAFERMIRPHLSADLAVGAG